MEPQSQTSACALRQTTHARPQSPSTQLVTVVAHHNVSNPETSRCSRSPGSYRIDTIVIIKPEAKAMPVAINGDRVQLKAVGRGRLT